MNNKTKITLSAKELELVGNKEWILTKQIIIEKVTMLFSQLAVEMQQAMQAPQNACPAEVAAINPKISKGENYLGLPWVMLDYPRSFTKGDVLAIRTFFWWGNFFSSTLQVAGKYKKSVAASLLAHHHSLQEKGYSICVSQSPWQHHLQPDNYIPVEGYSQNDFSKKLEREAFIKIALTLPVQQWSAAPEFLLNNFNLLAGIITTSFPNGEKGLSPGIPITGFDL